MDPTQRFSDRVENYAKFRPNYPDALIAVLQGRLPAPAVIADIGSGTGILSDQLLGAGYTVFGVEPNGPMRLESERRLGGQPRFHSVAGTAEATTLDSDSVDAVTCAQSFHWFDRIRSCEEFGRILRGPKLVLLIWNERISEDLMEEYDRILQESAPEYSRVGRRNVTDGDIADFFAPDPVELFYFPHAQRLDREGFLGRVLSSSYVPNVGQPGHEPVISKMEAFFDRHAQLGRIDFPYQTRVYLAHLNSG
ncbi:MAG: class I SAM-dependent methyltransferase [Verrucomicrobia bacterium]|nr:class I SAM-dependent methyltransferase [Verrucomicrobiota bacterium]MBV8274746.1 class I SAM-dependent methyltransferase [Verrucomicrobiota bacterium]